MGRFGGANLRRCTGTNVPAPPASNGTATGPGTAAGSCTPTWNLPSSHCRRTLCGRRRFGVATSGDDRSPSGRVFPAATHVVHLVLFAL